MFYDKMKIVTYDHKKEEEDMSVCSTCKKEIEF